MRISRMSARCHVFVDPANRKQLAIAQPGTTHMSASVVKIFTKQRSRTSCRRSRCAHY